MRWIVIGLALLGACGDDEPVDTGPHSHTDAPDEGCVADAPLDEYVQGFEKQGAAGYTVAIAQADPAPPDVGVNTWTLEIATPEGEALPEGAEVVVEPFMPQHGHGSSPAQFEATRGDDVWDVPPMDLFMPGVWELTVALSDEGEVLDEVLFRFCLEG